MKSDNNNPHQPLIDEEFPSEIPKGKIVPLSRLALIISLLVVGFGAVLYIHWKGMNAEVPSFESLKVIRANSLHTNMANSISQTSIEFSDEKGNRYQAHQLGSDEWSLIKESLSGSVPVLIRYGPWHSPFPSKKIFTVYQLEIGDSVILPYARVTKPMKVVKKHSLLITLLAAILVVGIIIFVLSHMKIEKQTTIHSIP